MSVQTVPLSVNAAGSTLGPLYDPTKPTLVDAPAARLPSLVTRTVRPLCSHVAFHPLLTLCHVVGQVKERASSCCAAAHPTGSLRCLRLTRTPPDRRTEGQVSRLATVSATASTGTANDQHRCAAAHVGADGNTHGVRPSVRNSVPAITTP